LTSKSTQAQHQATSTSSPPHPTPPPTQHGLPTVTQFMPHDNVFHTDFRGEQFSWSIADEVMVVSACGKFRKCIFCTPNHATKKGISVKGAHNLDYTAVRQHLVSHTHARATQAAHAACVEAHFPSLQLTQSLTSTMPRNACVTSAVRAQTLPSPAPSSAMSPALFQQSPSVIVLPALMQSNFLQAAQKMFEDDKKDWTQERERMDTQRKQQELKHREHMR